MGYHSSEYGLVAKVVNTLTPQGIFSLEQNRRLLAYEKQSFEAEIQSLSLPDDQQRELANELTDDFTIGQSTGQEFGAMWLNRASAINVANPPLVVLNGFMGNLTNVDDKMRSYFLARALPERQILVVEQLSQGMSDKYTPQERADLCKRGDASLVGTHMFRAIQEFVSNKMPETSTITVHGDSYGARIGLDVVKTERTSQERGLIDRLELFELPGTRNRRFGIHAAYSGYEWLRSNNYRDQWVEETKRPFVSYLEKYGNFGSPQPDFFHRDFQSALNNFWHTVLGHATGLKVLSELTNDDIQITRIVGGASRIDNPVYANREWLELGRTFVLGVVDHASHDALGALSHARLRSRLISSLGRYPVSASVLAAPFSFNLLQFSGKEPVQPITGARLA